MKDREKRILYIILPVVPFVLVFTVVAILLFSAFSTSIVVREYKVETKKLSQSITIALVADLHSCDYGEGQKELVDVIGRYKPDLIVLTGDIVDDILPRKNVQEFFQAITPTYPCYYVSGNHEYWTWEIVNVKNMIASYGIYVLEGDTLPVTVNGQTITLSGIDDPRAGRDKVANQLKTAAQGINPDRFSILLTHRPEDIEQYLPYGFDLILAGHTHGGQWRIPGILNGLFAPNQGLFPRYAGGRYDFQESSMVVSRGLARESTRVPRIFNRPELVIVTLLGN